MEYFFLKSVWLPVNNTWFSAWYGNKTHRTKLQENDIGSKKIVISEQCISEHLPKKMYIGTYQRLYTRVCAWACMKMMCS